MVNEKGQVAVDFLLGMSLVLIALGFTMQFIPGLFMSGSAGESSLDYTAYRTAAVLVEDTGWWENNTMNGTDWEYHPGNALRIGLAADDEPRSRLTDSPNLISRKKTEQFMFLNESTLVEMLGIYNDVDDTHFAYGYNISITQDNSPLILNNTTIVRGEVPPRDLETAKISRVVLVEKGTVSVFTGDEITGGSSSHATINVTGPFEDSINIELRNLNISGTNPAFLNARLDGNPLTQPSDFSIYKKIGWTNFPLNGSLGAEDTICLNLEHGLFNTGTDHRLDLEFKNITFLSSGSSFKNYNNRSTAFYEPAYLTVEVWQ
ncbi:MAG: hypothetical protein SCH66_01720 [Methanolobus sp.]|nr:hypothetical protein [Methanolobus sp.]